MRKDTARRLLAEFLGTFLLIFAGTGAVVLADLGIGSLVSIIFAHALVIMVVAYAHGDSSGSINPAATRGLFVAGDGEDNERRIRAAGTAGGTAAVIPSRTAGRRPSRSRASLSFP